MAVKKKAKRFSDSELKAAAKQLGARGGRAAAKNKKLAEMKARKKKYSNMGSGMNKKKRR